MKILNLGCGTKTSSNKNVINIDNSVYFQFKVNRILNMFAPFFFTGYRYSRFVNLPQNIKYWDLSKGIPFDDESIDVVYHSHLLEHFEKKDAFNFLLEIRRVLKPSGILRVVVPDFEELCQKYIAHIDVCDQNTAEYAFHDHFIEAIIGQIVRKEAHGTSMQPLYRRFIENLLLGSAQKRGQAHLWMYDRINLHNMLQEAGFTDIKKQDYNESSIPNWGEYQLDVCSTGDEYKLGSLYIEAKK